MSTDKKIVDRIDVFRDLLNPHENDRIDSSEESDKRLVKMKSLLAFNYEEFLKLCAYLDEHEIEPCSIGCFQDEDKRAHFEIRNKDGTISNLEFPQSREERSIDEDSID